MSARSGTEVRQRCVSVLVRMTPDESAALDEFVTARGYDSRPEALRSAALADGAAPKGQMTMPGALELMGSKEAAVLFGGLTKQQMHSLSHKPGFPEPLTRLAAGPIWDGTTLRAYAAGQR